MAVRSPAGVVFDLDGTLVLSERRNRRVWEAFLGPYGVVVDDARFARLTGRRGADSLVELAPLLPARPVEDLVAELVEVEAAVPLTVEAAPGAVGLVRRLRLSGMPLALVTSAMRPYASGVLDELGLTDDFAATVTAEDVATGKPDPEGFLSACRQLGVAPASAVGIEDSPAGVSAVKAAGMACIAVATTHPREVLSEADVVIDDFHHYEALGRPLLDAVLPCAQRS